ncbi:conserved hypothetical protein [Burkholderia pseudomallei 668]|nr:conserved hypothetical protein [Burkholderia pseudomallei 668]
MTRRHARPAAGRSMHRGRVSRRAGRAWRVVRGGGRIVPVGVRPLPGRELVDSAFFFGRWGLARHRVRPAAHADPVGLASA